MFSTEHPHTLPSVRRYVSNLNVITQQALHIRKGVHLGNEADGYGHKTWFTQISGFKMSQSKVLKIKAYPGTRLEMGTFCKLYE